MKKKFLVGFLILILCAIAVSITVSAEQSIYLPVNLVHNSYGSNYVLQLNTFDVVEISRQSETTNRVKYILNYSKGSGYAELYLVANCYDDTGNLIKTVDINTYLDYIDVPVTTATIEISVEKPVPNSQSYLHRYFVNVYAPDGRTLRITDLQVPLYESVGWRQPVTMYAPENGNYFARTLEVSPYEISVYENVGWYTFEEALFLTIKQNCNNYKSAKDYESIFKQVEAGLEYLTGTEYEYGLYSIRTEAMNLWRNYCGKPMGLIDYKISENSIGTPEATIYFRNLTYKKIVAFKIKFTCINVFGEVEDTYYDYYYDDEVDMDIAEDWWDTWTLYGADSVQRLSNIRITEVVFEDGTKWRG